MFNGRCEAARGPGEPLPRSDPPAGTSKKRKKIDEDVHRFHSVPEWVVDLVREEEGTDVCFIAIKTIEQSDLLAQQNRLFVPMCFVEANLVPMLSESERVAASLLDGGRRRSRPSHAVEELGGRRTKATGREHGGLPVTVFTRSRFPCHLELTRWDGSGGTVIKGKELKLFKAQSSLKQGDEVETWAFRLRRGGDLCFAIGGRSSSSSSNC